MSDAQKKKKVIVIGGGAAGMMAACAAAKNGCAVVLLEKNEKLGKKIFITGKGRCNVTNACDPETFFANVCTNEKFLYSAFYSFDNYSMMDFLEEAGCKLKVERGNRVFPVSDHSSDVIRAMEKELKRLGVEIRLNTAVASVEVKEMETEDGMKSIFHHVKLEDEKQIVGDSCIVCTGGISYPQTGSTGDGYRFAKETGHSVTACYPALVPLVTVEDWCRDLMGLSLRNVQLTLEIDGKKLYKEQGEMLFTHFGVSGPLVLSASSYYVKYLASGKKKDPETKLYLDLKPALTEEQLDKRLLRDFDENKNKQFKNSLGDLFPAKLIPVMIELSGISPECKICEVKKEMRQSFVKLIKHLPITVKGTGSFAEAIITRGGISVKEINPSTMESKKIKGLYFAGEVLDLDALTGGFNLQIAWSTGHLAGSEQGI